MAPTITDHANYVRYSIKVSFLIIDKVLYRVGVSNKTFLNFTIKFNWSISKSLNIGQSLLKVLIRAYVTPFCATDTNSKFIL